MSDVFGTVGNGMAMAGNLESTAAAADAVEAGVASAMADMKMNQASVATFIVEYGAAVVGGHGQVEGPGGVAGDHDDD
jgi:hypothetical protein